MADEFILHDQADGQGDDRGDDGGDDHPAKDHRDRLGGHHPEGFEDAQIV
ncbi:MAG: hypothetical protein ABSG43_23545 [Solirubrobacteraceae bacterium]